MTSRGESGDYNKRAGGRTSWRGRGYHDNRGGRGYWRGRGSWQGRGRGPRPSSAGYHRQQPDSQQPPATKRPRMTQSTLTDCPYKHWNMYLPEEGCTIVFTGLN